MSWLDLGLLVFFYFLGCHGITIGFHRHFTHGSFKAKRPLKIALAVAGSMAVEGPLVRWVADHRKHHKFSDAEGDPHSPWRYGETVPALLKGLWWAHIGWMFDEEQTPQDKYAPDLIKDPDAPGDLPPVRAVDGRVAGAAGADRRSGHDVVVGRVHRLLLGVARPGGAAAPRDVVDQLDLPRGRASARSGRGTVRATCGGWRCCPAVSPGTTCTTPTRPRRGTGWSGGSSTRAPG
ncbi:hypothetical protein GCM10019016_063130 [Streptomyces prasinosporus]|uniref:Fatty acid desaturase domain-containing protein n=1 Tax=Streptomyces prasinosporus TaxID=68256 RepID=A0ABP6TWX0_9ACTN